MMVLVTATTSAMHGATWFRYARQHGLRVLRSASRLLKKGARSAPFQRAAPVPVPVPVPVPEIRRSDAVWRA